MAISVPAPDRGGGVAGGVGKHEKVHGIPRSSFMQVPLSVQSEQLSRGRKVFEDLSSFARDKFQIEDMTARALLRAGQLTAVAENEVPGGSLQRGLLALRQFAAAESRQHSKLARQIQEQFYQPLEQAMARHADLVMRAKVGVQRSAQVVQETETRLAKAKRQVARALGEERGQRDSLTKGINDGRSSQKDIDWLMGKASRAAESVRHAEALVAGERHILLQAIQSRDDAVTSAARSFEMAERERAATISRAMTSFAVRQRDFYVSQMKELEVVTQAFAAFDPGGDMDMFIEKRRSMDHVPLYRVALSLLDWAGIADQDKRSSGSGGIGGAESGGVGDGGGWGSSRHARSSSVADDVSVAGGSVHNGSVHSIKVKSGNASLPAVTPLSEGRMRALPSTPAAAEAATVFGQRGSEDGDELHASQEMVDFSGSAGFGGGSGGGGGAAESVVHDARPCRSGSFAGNDGGHGTFGDGGMSAGAQRKEKDQAARIDALLRGLIPEKKRNGVPAAAKAIRAAEAFPGASATASLAAAAALPRSPPVKMWVGGGNDPDRRFFILDGDEDEEDEEGDVSTGGPRDPRHSQQHYHHHQEPSARETGDVPAAIATVSGNGNAEGTDAALVGASTEDGVRGTSHARHHRNHQPTSGAVGGGVGGGRASASAEGVPGTEAKAVSGPGADSGQVVAEQARRELEVLVRSESGRSRFLQVLNERRSEATEVTPEAYDALVGALEVFLDGCGPAPPLAQLAPRAAARLRAPATPATPPSAPPATAGRLDRPSIAPPTPASAPPPARTGDHAPAATPAPVPAIERVDHRPVPATLPVGRPERLSSSSSSLALSSARSSASPPGSPAGAFVGPAFPARSKKCDESSKPLEKGSSAAAGGSQKGDDGDWGVAERGSAAGERGGGGGAGRGGGEETLLSDAMSLHSPVGSDDVASPRSSFSLGTAAAPETAVPSNSRTHPATAAGAPKQASGSNRNGTAGQQKTTGANLFEFAASIMRGNSSNVGGGDVLNRSWARGPGGGGGGWSEGRNITPGGSRGGPASVPRTTGGGRGTLGGGGNAGHAGWLDQTPLPTPGGHYPVHSATAQGAIAETVELALGRGRTITTNRGQGGGGGGVYDNRGEGVSAAVGGMDGYLDVRSARQAMILANTFFKTEPGGGSVEGRESVSMGEGGREGRIYLLRNLRDHHLWKHPRFWHEALMLGVKEQLQEGPANASRWDDLQGEARREAVARTHNVVFSQLASIAFNMLECGVDGAVVRSDVTRKCRESQLGEAQVQELLRDLDRRIRLSDSTLDDEDSPAHYNKHSTSTAGDVAPPTAPVSTTTATAPGVSPTKRRSSPEPGFVPARALSTAAAVVGLLEGGGGDATGVVTARGRDDDNLTLAAMASAVAAAPGVSVASLAGGGGSLVFDIPGIKTVSVKIPTTTAPAAVLGGTNAGAGGAAMEGGLPSGLPELIRVCVSGGQEYSEDAWRAIVRLALSGAENDTGPGDEIPATIDSAVLADVASAPFGSSAVTGVKEDRITAGAVDRPLGPSSGSAVRVLFPTSLESLESGSAPEATSSEDAWDERADYVGVDGGGGQGSEREWGDSSGMTPDDEYDML